MTLRSFSLTAQSQWEVLWGSFSVSHSSAYQARWPYGHGSVGQHSTTEELYSHKWQNTFSGADKISLVIHLLYDQSCFSSNCFPVPTIFFLFRFAVLSGVMALAVAASAREEKGQGEWVPPVFSTVSKPLTIFFLLINLLTPSYCVHFGEKVEEGCAAGGKERTAENSWALKLED